VGAAGFCRGKARTDAGSAAGPEQVRRAGGESHLRGGLDGSECVPSLRGKVFLLFRSPLPPFQKCGAVVFASLIIRLGYYGVTKSKQLVS